MEPLEVRLEFEERREVIEGGKWRVAVATAVRVVRGFRMVETIWKSPEGETWVRVEDSPAEGEVEGGEERAAFTRRICSDVMPMGGSCCGICGICCVVTLDMPPAI